MSNIKKSLDKESLAAVISTIHPPVSAKKLLRLAEIYLSFTDLINTIKDRNQDSQKDENTFKINQPAAELTPLQEKPPSSSSSAVISKTVIEAQESEESEPYGALPIFSRALQAMASLTPKKTSKAVNEANPNLMQSTKEMKPSSSSSSSSSSAAISKTEIKASSTPKSALYTPYGRFRLFKSYFTPIKPIVNSPPAVELQTPGKIKSFSTPIKLHSILKKNGSATKMHRVEFNAVLECMSFSAPARSSPLSPPGYQDNWVEYSRRMILKGFGDPDFDIDTYMLLTKMIDLTLQEYIANPDWQNKLMFESSVRAYLEGTEGVVGIKGMMPARDKKVETIVINVTNVLDAAMQRIINANLAPKDFITQVVDITLKALHDEVFTVYLSHENLELPHDIIKQIGGFAFKLNRLFNKMNITTAVDREPTSDEERKELKDELYEDIGIYDSENEGTILGKIKYLWRSTIDPKNTDFGALQEGGLNIDETTRSEMEPLDTQVDELIQLGSILVAKLSRLIELEKNDPRKSSSHFITSDYCPVDIWSRVVSLVNQFCAECAGLDEDQIGAKIESILDLIIKIVELVLNNQLELPFDSGITLANLYKQIKIALLQQKGNLFHGFTKALLGKALIRFQRKQFLEICENNQLMFSDMMHESQEAAVVEFLAVAHENEDNESDTEDEFSKVRANKTTEKKIDKFVQRKSVNTEYWASNDRLNRFLTYMKTKLNNTTKADDPENYAFAFHNLKHLMDNQGGPHDKACKDEIEKMRLKFKFLRDTGVI